MTNEPTLLQDIYSSSEWVANALNVSGYKADYSLESMRELDHFLMSRILPPEYYPKTEVRFYLL